MDNFDIKKFLGEKSLLNENAPGYDTRKMGEALPTLESVKAAYEAKNDIEEESFGAANTDKRSGQVIGEIIQMIRDTGIDPSDVLEEVGQEFGIAFEFGRGQ